MIPHSHHSPDELREMVGWIYSLEPAGLVRVFQGFVAEIPVAAEEAAKPGYYRLDAAYTDLGNGIVPPLAASTTLYVRQRLVEAELADEIRGPQILNSGNASGGRFIGAINHGHWLLFRNVPLDQVGSIRLMIASAGAGGSIEIRRDGPEGELFGQVPVEVNGSWEQFYERILPLPNKPTAQMSVSGLLIPATQAG